LIDRELPRLQARLDELTKIAEQNKAANPSGTAAPSLTPDQQKEFIDLTSQVKLLTDRRAQILTRTGDDYITDPPKLPAKP
jgi:hypothetical protein